MSDSDQIPDIQELDAEGSADAAMAKAVASAAGSPTNATAAATDGEDAGGDAPSTPPQPALTARERRRLERRQRLARTSGDVDEGDVTSPLIRSTSRGDLSRDDESASPVKGTTSVRERRRARERRRRGQLDDDEAEQEAEEEVDEFGVEDVTRQADHQLDLMQTLRVEKGPMTDRKVKLEWEGENLVVVTNNPEAFYSKYEAITGRDFVIRDTEEDGLYLGNLSGITPWNRARLEQRLLLVEEGLPVWFEPDGTLALEPDPVKPVYTRPNKWFDPHADYLQVVRTRPTAREFGVVSQKQYILDVDIRNITFTDHPRFSEEDFLSAKLTMLYNEYHKRQQRDLVRYYTSRLRALRNIALKEPPPPAPPETPEPWSLGKFGNRRKKNTFYEAVQQAIQHEKRIERTRVLIRQTRQLRDAEEFADLVLVRRMILLWKRLKKLRADQGYSVTRSKLAIRRIPTNYRDMKEIEDQEIEDELEEMREDHEALQDRRQREYNDLKRDLEDRRRKREERISELERARESEKNQARERRRRTRERAEALATARLDKEERINEARRSDLEKKKTLRSRLGRKKRAGGGADAGAGVGSGVDDDDDDDDPDRDDRDADDERDAHETEEDQERRKNLAGDLDDDDEPPADADADADKPVGDDDENADADADADADAEDPPSDDDYDPAAALGAPRSSAAATEPTPKRSLKDRLLRRSKKQDAAQASRHVMRSQEEEEASEAEEIKQLDRKFLREIEEMRRVKLPMPKKPKRIKFNEKLRREELRERYAKTKTRPGDPLLVPLLYPEGHAGTPSDELPPDEVQRQKMIRRHTYTAKLFINDRLVAKTSKAQPLRTDFTVVFGEIFPIKLIKWPTSVRIALFEDNGAEPIASCYVSIPGAEDVVSGESESHDTYGFSSQTLFLPDWERPEPGTRSSEGHFLGGSLNARCQWRSEIQGRVPELPPGPRKDASKPRFAGGGVINVKRLKDWLRAIDFDPNDPRNAAVAELLHTSEMLADEGEVFSTKSMDVEAQFETETFESKRHRLLRWRHERVMAATRVPITDDEIQDDMLENFERPEEPEDKYRERVADSEFIRKVREKEIVQRIREPKKRITVADYVSEQPLPDIQQIVSIVVDFFKPRRPLQPRRRARKTVALPTECKLLLTVQRVYNLPVRKQASLHGVDRADNSSVGGGSNEDDGMDDNEFDERVDTNIVLPFVEVAFQDKVVQTPLGIGGANAQFNHGFSMPFVPPQNDFSPTNLSTVSDHITLNVFDQATVNVKRDDRAHSEMHVRRLKRWLGSLTIPFSTVYTNERVEGTFMLESPALSLGYEHEHEDPRAYLTIYMTLEPPLPRAEDDDEGESIESYHVEQRALEFNKILKPRNATVLANDSNGESLLITRYILKQVPPPGMDTVEACVRYVSLIPFLEDAISFIGRSDCWNSSDEFLEIRAGDWEEHAVLLCNYFLSLRKNAYVMLGTAVPEGETAYVVVIEREDEVHFWNASTGQRYMSTDLRHPVMDVAALFNQDNIWVNIQDFHIPSQVLFDLNNAKHWRPFFTNDFPQPAMETVQIPRLRYEEPKVLAAQDLERTLERVIQSKIEEWRPRFPTGWNRVVGRTLRSLLVKLEDARRELRQMSEDDFSSELSRLKSSYHVFGVPINRTYTEEQAIVKAVFNTSIHSIEDPENQISYALAVYVKPYPNRIYSVWVYVAVLTPL